MQVLFAYFRTSLIQLYIYIYIYLANIVNNNCNLIACCTFLLSWMFES